MEEKYIWIKKIIINHIGASSVKSNSYNELGKNRNWHWMWSTYSFQRKHKGFLLALLIILPKLFASIIKIIYYQIIFSQKKRNVYICRLSGIINSILGRNSWYRPSID